MDKKGGGKKIYRYKETAWEKIGESEKEKGWKKDWTYFRGKKK